MPSSNPKAPQSNRFYPDDRTINELVKDIESLSEQVKKVLDMVRTSELDFAAFKIELRILCENVKNISSLLRDDSGGASLITRVILLENKIKELESDVEKAANKERASAVPATPAAPIVPTESTVDKQGKWQLRVATATGIISLLGMVITAIANHYK